MSVQNISLALATLLLTPTAWAQSYPTDYQRRRARRPSYSAPLTSQPPATQRQPYPQQMLPVPQRPAIQLPSNQRPPGAWPPVAPAQPLRNQNPLGQPAELPPHLRAKEDFAGTKNWYASAGSAFGYELLSRNDPGAAECNDNCKKTIDEPRWALFLQGAAGWGPIKRNSVSFTTHYRYSQNLRTNQEQLDRFGNWFKTFKSADFIFPTRDMLRSHELVAEVRYSMTPFQFGLHGLLDFEFVGSRASFLGAPNEMTDNVRNVEQVVPWVQWRIPGTYIATLYSPMRTEINKEDPRTSFTTWSLKRAGRGIVFALVEDNLFYLPSISSTANLNVNYTRKKSASIQNDSNRMGARATLDFPIAWNIRMQPYIKYDRDTFVLPRIKIDNVKDGNATLQDRSDSIIGSGGTAYLDISKHWRFSFLVGFESTQSTLSDFSGSKMLFQGGLNYSWPLNRPVLRRLDRFSDSLSSEEN